MGTELQGLLDRLLRVLDAAGVPYMIARLVRKHRAWAAENSGMRGRIRRVVTGVAVLAGCARAENPQTPGDFRPIDAAATATSATSAPVDIDASVLRTGVLDAGGLRVGERLPNIAIPLEGGKAVQSTDLRGKPLVLRLANTDCLIDDECSPWAHVADTCATVAAATLGDFGAAHASDVLWSFSDIRALHPTSVILTGDHGAAFSALFGGEHNVRTQLVAITDDKGIIKRVTRLRDRVLGALEAFDDLESLCSPKDSGGPSAESADSGSHSDTRTFRNVLVGGLPFKPERVTWTLSRVPDRARLEVRTQTNASRDGPIHLDGAESSEGFWSTSELTTYEGRRATDGPDHYEFFVASGPINEATYRELPPHFELRCADATKEVLPAGAKMTRQSHDWKSLEGWTPSHGTLVKGWGCEAAIRGVPWIPAGLATKHSPTFFFVSPTARLPGVEWADENSGPIRGAALRWMKP